MDDGVTGRGARDELLVEVRGPIRLLTLNRAEAYNAADEALHGELVRIWHELDADPEVRAIVLTGSGGAFSAGGDLHLLDRMVGDEAVRSRIMAEAMEIVRSMTSVRAPIVSAVNGPAVGLGCSLASMSDLVVVEEHAYFADPHVALGLVAADGGALTWPLLTSLLRAKEFVLLGDRVPAADAVQLGLANRVVPTGTAVEVALELAERLAALPPQSVIETKALLNAALRGAVDAWLVGAVAAETASFDEPAFQANLTRMLERSTTRMERGAHGRLQLDAPADRAPHYLAEGWWDARTLADGIEEAAIRCPEVLALADGDRELTYAELAGSVAAGMLTLDRSGVGAGDAIILVAGNTIAAVVAYHASLRSGVTALLLDRRCGTADLHFALDVLPDAAVVASASDHERLLTGIDSTAIPLEAFGRRDAASPSAPVRALNRDAPAVVLFTSGTTSRPKAVVHSLNTLTAGAANMALITGADERTTAFLVSPLTSITGVMQMHLVADQHAALVLEDSFDPEASLDRLNRAGATLLGGAPVIAERLLRAAEQRGTRRIALQTLALGGSMLPRPLLELATDAFGIEIARVYGSSEAPNFSGSLPGDDRARRLGDDGALMPGGEVRVGSSGHPHEGLLRGPSLFLGYADAGDHASAFKDGWFRSGDLVDVHDGRLTVIGRLKADVNRNGLKISLDEIDAALAGLPGAVEHASFGVADPATVERLVVAVQPDDGATVTLDGVIAHLLDQGTARRKLPEELILWDGPLPRTTSGKVVRSRLVLEAVDKRSERASRLTS